MNWYTVDESGSTRPCGVLEYFEWHAAMPESSSWYASKTGCGFSIASDVLENGIRVSTVFLGLNHAYDGGPPAALGDDDVSGVRHLREIFKR